MLAALAVEVVRNPRGRVSTSPLSFYGRVAGWHAFGAGIGDLLGALKGDFQVAFATVLEEPLLANCGEDVGCVVLAEPDVLVDCRWLNCVHLGGLDVAAVGVEMGVTVRVDHECPFCGHQSRVRVINLDDRGRIGERGWGQDGCRKRQ